MSWTVALNRLFKKIICSHFITIIQEKSHQEFTPSLLEADLYSSTATFVNFLVFPITLKVILWYKRTPQILLPNPPSYSLFLSFSLCWVLLELRNLVFHFLNDISSYKEVWHFVIVILNLSLFSFAWIPSQTPGWININLYIN